MLSLMHQAVGAMPKSRTMRRLGLSILPVRNQLILVMPQRLGLMPKAFYHSQKHSS